MLDMGFIHDVRRIVSLTPKSRQTLLFSATMPRDIVDLARSILHDPARIDVAPASATPDRVQQSVYFVARADKRRLLERLLQSIEIDRALVFTRTKRGASRVARLLDGAGIRADAIHGDKTQGARLRALSDFKRGATRVLVATDIAARGIDVDGVSHVINYDMPDAAESYVHRIGRTGRAGASGIALSFCDNDERAVLKDIERLMGRRVPVATGAAASETPHRDAPQERSPAHPRNRSETPHRDAPKAGPAQHRNRDEVRAQPPRGNVAACNSSQSPSSPEQSKQRPGRWRGRSERRRTSSSWS
jgi:ATP-dependent RNA helicase RhlE